MRSVGIVNVTPDSFSDGGRYFSSEKAIAHGLDLVYAGADVLDVGGESTRPGAQGLAPDEECARVLPVIRGLRAAGFGGDISIDTYHVDVARKALATGATVLNDVTGFQDPLMRAMAAEAQCDCVIMHMPQAIADVHKRVPSFTNVTAEVGDWLLVQAHLLEESGLAREHILLDPGFGFGKSYDDTLRLFEGMPAFCARMKREGYRVYAGISRKRFVGKLFGIDDTRERDEATAQLSVALAESGVEHLRVHDIAALQAAVCYSQKAAHRAYIALGSNQDDPVIQLRLALRHLTQLPATSLECVASTYVSEPAYDTNQAPFYNTVVQVETHLGPLALFAELQALERVQHRVKTRINGPRSIDLDLLAYDDEVINLPHLTVPHPRMAERAFVVQPLLDIAPQFCFSTGQQLSREAARLGAIMNSYPPLEPAVMPFGVDANLSAANPAF